MGACGEGKVEGFSVGVGAGDGGGSAVYRVSYLKIDWCVEVGAGKGQLHYLVLNLLRYTDICPSHLK